MREHSDLKDLFYPDALTYRLKGLIGKTVLSVLTDNHMLTKIIMADGQSLRFTPSDVSISEKTFDEAGWSYVKRAYMFEDNEPFSEGELEELLLTQEKIVRIAKVRVAVSIEEEQEDLSTEADDDDVFKWLSVLECKLPHRTFLWEFYHPDKLHEVSAPPRSCVVDLGYIFYLTNTIISAACYDNVFSMEPARVDAAFINSEFLRTYQLIDIGAD